MSDQEPIEVTPEAPTQEPETETETEPLDDPGTEVDGPRDPEVEPEP